MILRVRWNGHLAVEWASGVELASCQFHAYFRAGRMPTLRILILVERASCPLYEYSFLWGGQDAHSRNIHSKIQQRP
ncbi:MAG: hypothetical protein F6J94_02190 [Moorea sp. SIO1F2]|uniref:hypothetical protein n=1 Tax=Moorena sp. SIO1F2 TaxID=2607819 RepID=UPI0013B8AC75|nr:hypothetical protein [Moorena sp. SIO1F2]NET80826.1 hypothetical protein [Moorena sp. SIO1F2]